MATLGGTWGFIQFSVLIWNAFLWNCFQNGKPQILTWHVFLEDSARHCSCEVMLTHYVPWKGISALESQSTFITDRPHSAYLNEVSSGKEWPLCGLQYSKSQWSNMHWTKLHRIDYCLRGIQSECEHRSTSSIALSDEFNSSCCVHSSADWISNF